MGKAIQPKTLKGVPKKRTQALTVIRKKPDIIESYLRTLSNNFGLNSSNPSKRKYEETSDEETPLQKRQKKESTQSSSTQDFSICNIRDSIKFQYLTTHLECNDELKDLFHIDDAKCNNEYTYYTDWLHQLCEEISLEGLDGITVEALWSRIKSSFPHPVLIEGKEEIFWNLLKYLDHIQYFILEHPRGNLVIYDKNDFLCPDTGMVLEPIIDSGEIYPYSMVNKDGIRGSCSSFNTRLENSAVIRKLGLKEALNIYGNRLVIVASQKMRENAIINEIADPTIELSDNEYGILERVGRARGFGELTQGKVSVLNIIKDSRSIFHLRKTLEGKKLLKKQFFILRNAASGQNKTGKLLHLPRFYKLQKNKTVLLIEEIVEVLRQKPGFALEFGEFRKYFPRSTGVNKILKMPEFTKYVKTDICHPYRYFYPNAKMSEWKCKNSNKEKNLRIFQLIDPTVNVAATWNSGTENEDPLENEEIEEKGQGSKIINSEFIKEVFTCIFKTGKEGITLQELVKKINFDYYTLRTAIRKLQVKNVIDSMRADQGKQRHIYYFARCFHSKHVPMPMKKTTKIPENLLQKIIRDKKSSTNTVKNVLSLSIDCQTIFRDSSCSYPLLCTALVTLDNTSDQNKLEVEEYILNVCKPSSTKLIIPSLPDIQILPKFCYATFEQKKKVWKWKEIENVITGYSSYNTTIKIILLKCMLAGGSVDIQRMLNGDDNENQQLEMLALDFESLESAHSDCTSRYATSKDFLLGPNPIEVARETTSEKIEIVTTQSTPPESYKNEYQTYTSLDKNITAVSLARTNIILEEINNSLMICDIYKLQKIVTDQEKTSDTRKDVQGRIDKSTMHRILVRLVNEGYIKIFKFFAVSSEKCKCLWVVAHPSVEATHPFLISAKEQFVSKFLLGMDRRNIACTEKPVAKIKKSNSPFNSKEATNSFQMLKKISKTKSSFLYKQNRAFGRILGYQPKFIRMQIFHELLFYLIYNYESLDQLSRTDVKEVFQEYQPDEIKEIPPIYQKTIDWKMFIPPLPIHKNFTNGWALICDIILSIPLCLWVKIFYISVECHKLLSFLSHPIRQHYLIKDVPAELRYALMHRRKYLYSAVEIVYRLCFIGLVQLGPQSTSVKDQIFLYLNRKAGLLDTSSSGPSYHMITKKSYKKLSFTFFTSGDVDDYWYQLWTISMNTPLGQRRIMEGKSVTIETPTLKPMLLDCLKAKTPDEVIENDNGHIPGDRRGAGGLDSSMWSHFKRNWIWSGKMTKLSSSTNLTDNKSSVRAANIASIKPVTIKYKELVNQSRRVYITNIHKNSLTNFNSKQKKKNKIIQRKIVIKRKPTVANIESMDTKDKMILKKNGKIFKAEFSETEDKILYICRVANFFLSKNTNIFKASRFLVRDLLHILSPESQHKTSRACARRMNKCNDLFMKRLQEHASDLINIKDLSTHFAPIIYNINQSSLESASCYSCYSNMDKKVAYVHAVWYIYKNYEIIEKILQGESKSIDYFSPENIETFGPLLVDTENKKSVFNSPTSQVDIEREAVKSVLMSALNCSKLGQNISYQFYQICKKFSDYHIRSAVNCSKSHQAITINKNRQKSAATTIKSIPFQLSKTYNNMQKSTFNTLTFQTIFQHFLESVLHKPEFSDANNVEEIFIYSRLLARNELATAWPKHTVTLNIPEFFHGFSKNTDISSDSVRRLAEVYQKYLKETVDDMDKKIKIINNKISVSVVDTHTNTKKFVNLKTNIRRLLSNLPCYYNETITKNIPLFLESNNEDEIIRFLEIFLDELIKIVLNLFSTKCEAQKLLQNFIAKFRRAKKIHFLHQELEFKIFKLAYIVRQFLNTNDLTEIIHCFDNKLIKSDENLMEIIQKWFEKSKIVPPGVVNDENPKNVEKQNHHSCFFKYKMPRGQNEIKVMNSKEDVPEIEEIVEGMLDTTSDSERSIPHISDVVNLLSHDKCSNPDDETILESLKDNFVFEYPTLEKFEVLELAQFKKLHKYLFRDKELPDLEIIVSRYCHVKESDTFEMTQKIKEKGGTKTDQLLAGEMISFVYNQKFLGATGSQIMNTFSSRQRSLDLHEIVEILCDSFIFLEVGVTEKTFVHIEHSDPWLVETFHLSPHENHLLHASANDELQILQKKIESRIQSSKPVKVIMMPWLHLDGTLNFPLLQKWLIIVLSFCLESQNCTMEYIFERFYLVKPVELYFLLKILQELKCLKIYTFEDRMENLWSDAEETEIRSSHILDSFCNMYIEVNPLATISLGCYLSKEAVEFQL